MRILIDARKAFDSGIGTYIRCVLPRVIDRLHTESISVLVEPGGQGRHDYLHGHAVRYIEIPDAPLGLKEQVGLRRETAKADLFWATSLAHPLFSRTPVIATVHDVAQLAMSRHTPTDLLVKAAAGLYFRSLRSTARLLLFNSSFTQAEFMKRVGRPTAQHLVTPLGVEQRWFAETDKPRRATQEYPYLVCISNLRPHKNLLLLLRAFEQVSDRLPHRLVLVGKSEGFRSGSREVSAIITRLAHRIDFTGFQPDPELRSCVAGADALVVPSLYEGFGLPALEAMASGTPVIAARAGALPEVCGDCALFFDPFSVQELAEQFLVHTQRSDDHRNAQRACGLERARRFDWDHTAELTAVAIHAALRPAH